MVNPFDYEKIYLTFSFKNKRNKKPGRPIVILRKHILLTIVLISFISCGSIYSYGQYRISDEKLSTISEELDELKNTNTELENKASKLEVENDIYNNQISELAEKTELIETKVSDLENTKEDIMDTIETINGSNNLPTSFAASGSNTFIPIIITPYTSNNIKLDTLSAKLGNLEAVVAVEEVEFVDVTETVLTTLSYVASTPSIWPVNGEVSSEFGYRGDPFTNNTEFHAGIDIRVPTGTPVAATAAGVVIAANYSSSGYGNVVEIDHGNGYVTLYAHNSSLNVSTGDKVSQGSVIAYSGATGLTTGPHVHYEIIYNGEYLNPRNYFN